MQNTYIFKEDLEYTTRLLIDETRDTLHTPTTSETTNGGLCDTLDVVAKNFTVTLGTTLSETLTNTTVSEQVQRAKSKQVSHLSTFSASRHCL